MLLVLPTSFRPPGPGGWGPAPPRPPPPPRSPLTLSPLYRLISPSAWLLWGRTTTKCLPGTALYSFLLGADASPWVLGLGGKESGAHSLERPLVDGGHNTITHTPQRGGKTFRVREETPRPPGDVLYLS